MNRSAQFSAIGRIYETILASSDFRPLLETILQWTGADEAHFWQYDSATDTSIGLTSRKLPRRKFAHTRLCTEGAARARPPASLGDDGMVFGADGDAATALACLAIDNGKYVYLETAIFPRGGKAAPQNAAFGELVQILRHAIGMNMAPVSAKFGHRAAQILDRLAVGIAVYDPAEGTLTGANRRAQKLLEKQGIRLDAHSAFGMQKPPLAKSLAGFAATALSAEETPVLLDWLDDNRSISLLAFPLEQGDTALDAPVAFLFLPDDNSGALEAYIARRHGLTQREQAVARALLCGQKLPDIALALNLGHETVRSHAKAIFAKCDVHGHAEFVAKFLTGIDAFDWNALTPAPEPALEAV